MNQGKQPEAVSLAEWIEGDMTCQGDAEIATELRRLHAENEQFRAARIAYASEFPPNQGGMPDVGSIHQNIRKLKKEVEHLKTVPMKYRRMEFNAQLQNENNRLEQLNAELLPLVQKMAGLVDGLERGSVVAECTALAVAKSAHTILTAKSD